MNRNLKNLKDALEYYRKAIELDNEKVDAWKGALEIYQDNNWSDFQDDFSIKVVDHLIAHEELSK